MFHFVVLPFLIILIYDVSKHANSLDVKLLGIKPVSDTISLISRYSMFTVLLCSLASNVHDKYIQCEGNVRNELLSNC